MNQNIFKCAAESYMYGVGFLKEFYEDEGYPYFGGFGKLRMAIMNIHNAVELLLKAHLAKLNELLIISDIGNEDVLGIIRSEKDEKKKLGLLYYLYHEGNTTKTIEYSEVIRRYSRIFSLNKQTINILTKLGIYRNMATHLGINKEPIEIHEILAVLGATIEFIEDELTYNIKIDDESLEVFLKVEDDAKFILSTAIAEAEVLWFEYFRESIISMLNDISEAFKTKSFISMLKKNNVLIEFDLHENIEYEHIKIKVKSISDDRDIYSIITAKPLSNTFHLRFYDAEGVSEIIIEFNTNENVPKLHFTGGYIDEDIVLNELYWKDKELKKSISIISKDYNTEMISAIVKKLVLESTLVKKA